jgi:hypothetical protein
MLNRHSCQKCDVYQENKHSFGQMPWRAEINDPTDMSLRNALPKNLRTPAGVPRACS